MTVRSRSTMKQDAYSYGTCTAEGEKSSTATRVSVGQAGTYEYISSVDSGSFEPGNDVRINEAIIHKTVSTLTPGSGKWFKTIPTPCARFWIEGNFLPSNSQNQGLWNSNLHSLSKTKSLAKLNDAKADLGMMLGELAETAGMLNGPLKGIVDLTQKYKSAMGKGGAALSSAWLLYIFGIMPLISDCQDIMTALEAKVTENNDYLRSRRGTESTKEISTGISNVTVTGTTVMIPVLLVKTTEWSSTSIWYYRLLLELEALSKLGKWGLSPSQFIPTAYELVPYSFLVDWFSNLGSFIRALMPLANVKILGGCTSQVITTTNSAEAIAGYLCHASKPYSYPLDEFTSPKQVAVTKRLERRIETSTTPDFALEADPMNLRRVITSLALIYAKGYKLFRAIGRLNHAT